MASNTGATSPVSLSMKDSQAIADMAEVLYDFLPGSGNPRLSFPVAATRVGVERHWTPGSKKPAIVGLLQGIYAYDRHRLCPFIEEVVRQSMTWRRGKGSPLQREEIASLNAALQRLGFKIPELHDSEFLGGLSSTAVPSQRRSQPIGAEVTAAMQQALIALSALEPRARGTQFEGFLTDLFAASDLAPRGSIRHTGEQIDGSFELDRVVYLVEAKWQAEPTGNADLLVLSGKVGGKAEWSRGMFISYTGFTQEGLTAFAQGRQTNIVCLDGLDLFHIVSGKLDLSEVVARKVRAAAESNRAFVPVRELFANVT